MAYEMRQPERSSVALQSNVYPVNDELPCYDENFIRAIHDPELLELFENRFSGRYKLSSLQESERQFAIHCALANPGDFPWGTISDKNSAKVVCRCEKRSCRAFPQCRPDAAVPENKGADEERDRESSSVETPEEISLEDMNAINKSFYGNLKQKAAEEAAVKVASEETEADTSAHAGAEEERREAEPETRAEIPEAYASLDASAQPTDYAEFSGDSPIFDTTEFAWEEDEEPYELDGSEQESDEEASEEAPNDSKYNEPATPTEEQQEIISMPAHARAIVNAGPGTGKTFTLIEKIEHMLQEQDIPSDEILVLCFSNAAVNVIGSRLEDAAASGKLTVPWQSLDVRTFDKFATWILYQGAKREPSSVPPNLLLEEGRISKLGYEDRIAAARSIIAHWKGLFDNVSHLFVDETQDIVGPRADLVLEILRSLPNRCGFTLLGDSCQAIYDYSLFVRVDNRITKRGTSSAKMIDEVETSHHPTMLTLEENHRLQQPLPYSLRPLRAALLDGDEKSARNAIAEIIDKCGDESEDIRDLEKPTIERIASKGSLGILTRSNGEALYISSLLRGKSIRHHLRRAKRGETPLARIVADIFYDYEQDSIDKDEFVARAIEAGGGSVEECTDAWYELADACRNKAMGSRYLAEDLIQCLAANSRRSPFFASGGEGEDVTVGTIHSAKGREYDAVWLAVEDLEKIAKKGNLGECKTAYVALSRPIHSLDLKRFKTSHRIDCVSYKNGTKRNYCVSEGVASKLSRTKARSLSRIELVPEMDVNPSSFGRTAAIQDTIRHECVTGCPLSLLKSKSPKGVAPTYIICIESDEGRRPIGQLMPSFAEGYTYALSRANRVQNPAQYLDKCPEAFDDVYVEDVITCVGGPLQAPSHAKRFGETCIWYGITITGFAKENRQSY